MPNQNEIAITLRAEIEDALDRVKEFAAAAKDALEAVDSGDPEASQRLEGAVEGLTQAYTDLGETARSSLKGAGSSAEEASAAIEEAARVTADALELPQQFVDKAARAVDQMADRIQAYGAESKEAQQLLQGLTQETRQAGEQGIESGERITKAFQRAAQTLDQLGDEAKLTEVLMEELGESPAENLGRVHSEGEQTLVTLAQLGNAVKRLAEESGEGLGSFADNAAKARVAIRELEEQMERQGDSASPALRRELDRLKDQYETTFESGRKRVIALEQEIRQVEIETRRGLGGISGATAQLEEELDALIDRFPRLTIAVAKAGFALKGIQVTYGATRKAVEFLDEALGTNIDLTIQQGLAVDKLVDASLRLQGIERAEEEQLGKVAARRRALLEANVSFLDSVIGINQAYRDLVPQQEGFLALTDDEIAQLEALENRRRVLIARNIEFKNSVFGINRAYEEFIATLRDTREAELAAEALLDSIQGFTAREFRDAADEIIRSADAIREALERNPEAMKAFQARLRELLQQAESLGDRVDSGLIKSLTDLARTFGVLSPSIEELQLKLEELGLQSSESINQSIQAILNYEGAIRIAGTATNEQAELIVGEIQGILSAIRSLPEGQSGVNAEMVDRLEQLAAEYSQLTDSVREEMQALLAEQEAAFEGLADTVGQTVSDMLAELRRLREGDQPEVEGPDPETIRSQIQDLETELEGLEDLQFQPFGEAQETAARISEIKDQLFELRGSLRDLPPPAETVDPLAEASANLRDKLIEVLGSSEDFARGFEALGSRGQESVRGIIELFDLQTQTGRVTEQQVLELGESLTRVFERAGVPVQDLQDLMLDLRGETDVLGNDVTALLDKLDERAQNSAFAKLRDDTEDLTEATISFAGETKKALTETEKQTRAITDQSGKVRDLTGNYARVGDAVFDLGSEVREVADASGDAVEGVGRLAEAGGDLAAAASDITRETPETTEALSQVGPAARDSAKGVQELFDVLDRPPSVDALDVIFERLGEIDIRVGEITTRMTDLIDLAGDLQAETREALA